MAQTIAEIEDRSVISPMMQKYIETKEKYNDCILFYRLKNSLRNISGCLYRLRIDASDYSVSDSAASCKILS